MVSRRASRSRLAVLAAPLDHGRRAPAVGLTSKEARESWHPQRVVMGPPAKRPLPKETRALPELLLWGVPAAPLGSRPCKGSLLRGLQREGDVGEVAATWGALWGEDARGV